ncbi:hypothetical protein ASE66_27630 [Bosea sp. Root483D1]|nr:hypothetical protein ASE66_27630 [Bosea sp. Root483D1]
MAPVAIIWDGSRHVAAIWRQSAPARFLAAEETSGRISLIAAADAGTAPLFATLPPGSHALHAVTVEPDGRLGTIPVQLDDRLSLAEADRNAASLTLVQAYRDDDGGLAEQTGPAETALGAALLASGLNRTSGSKAEGYRLLAGPFLHPDDERAATTTLTARRSASGGLTLAFAGDAGEAAADGLLVAHLPAAMREARQALAQIDQDLRLAIEAELDTLAASPADQRDVDATGLGRVAALRRGFRLLRPRAEAEGGVLSLPDWVEADDIIVFSEPRRQLVWNGDSEAVGGSPMTLRWREGAFAAVPHGARYTASAATGLTLGQGGGNALVVAVAGGAAPLHDDLALAAGRLADGLWRATSTARPARLGALLGEIALRLAQAPTGALARLDARSKSSGAPAGLLEALAGTSGIDPDRIDELGERSLSEQVAMLLRALAQPRLAARACAARLVLPLPGSGPDEAGLERLLAWYEDPNLPQALAREAMALAGHDRRAMRLLHDVAASVHQTWIETGLAAEVEQAVAVAATQRGQRRLSPLDALLLELRRRPQRQPTPGLEAIARMRSELAETAQQSGQSPAITDELSRRLGELTPGEIVLLHGHFAVLRREADQALAAAALIRSWEAALGLEGLAARAHRGGDPVRGAQRLAAASRSFAGSLSHIESLAQALTELKTAIDGLLGPADEGTARNKALRETLDGYGRLLLAQLVRHEADSAFASVPFAGKALADLRDTGFGAAYRRLRAGSGDMLPRYLAAAAALTGLDHHWGTALTGGTTADTASRQDA